jgi:hypothetical protein
LSSEVISAEVAGRKKRSTTDERVGLTPALFEWYLLQAKVASSKKLNYKVDLQGRIEVATSIHDPCTVYLEPGLQ